MGDLRDRYKNPSETNVDQKVSELYAKNQTANKRSVANDAEEGYEYSELFSRLLEAVTSATKQLKTLSNRAYKTVTYKVVHQRKQMAVAVFVVILASTGIALLAGRDNSNPQVQGDSSLLNTPVEPEFDVFYPAEIEVENIAYDPEKKVASYSTIIDDSRVIYSQQEITAVDATRENFLLTVAQSFGINRELPTNSGTVFIGSNARQQVVTAVTLRGTNLVFLRSSGTISDQSVVDFVNSLE